MKRTRCLRCGLTIKRGAIEYDNLCVECENDMMPEERFAYFES